MSFETILALLFILYVTPAIGCLLFCYNTKKSYGDYWKNGNVKNDVMLSLMPIVNLLLYLIIATFSISELYYNFKNR